MATDIHQKPLSLTKNEVNSWHFAEGLTFLVPRTSLIGNSATTRQILHSNPLWSSGRRIWNPAILNSANEAIPQKNFRLLDLHLFSAV